jgi:predicted permease
VIGLPLGPGGGIGHSLGVEGQPVTIPGTEPSVRVRPVVGEYFRALRIPILSGRPFTDADDERAVPVAIINEALARTIWPDRSPLGHRVKWVGAEGTPPWLTIVGVASDTKTSGLTTADQPAVYVPYVQHTEAWQRWGTLVVRGPGDPARLGQTLQAAVSGVDPLVPLGRVARLTEYWSAAMAPQRLDAVVLVVFAAGALLIAIQGIYGTLAYLVEQRRREIGIRVAIGATPRAVRRTVVARGMRATGIGLAVGALVAVAAGRVVGGMLYGVSPTDPVTYLAVAAIVASASWCGALVPAMRASRADPLSALRTN